jgi:hypothetical protein
LYGEFKVRVRVGLKGGNVYGPPFNS